MDIILSEDEQQELVDAINKMLPLIPDSELEIEVIELPEGGAEYRYHMSERVRAIFENLAFFAGHDHKRIPEMDRAAGF
ncbi:hypothetical protein E4P82_20135 [Candidatus Competibacter phosphatis]|uniref:Uncharacterized protein n=1 Tax=Candidatus Competibacter phosphatis TaxID=221280 RepID=A0ABX1TS02_9GAMM|nr:hypothetical protein [Candidatus Competibacter phosphatis]NMQ21304.1 hypothetical protein [Candidatus Competibacter phosphatis]